MLADAIELLPPARLHAVARQYLDLRRLRPDSKKARANLLADVKAFEFASLVGDFYESLEVNSKNFMEQSSAGDPQPPDPRRAGLSHGVAQ